MDDSIFIQFGHKFEMHRGFNSISGCLAKQIVLNNDTTTILSILQLLYLYIEYIFIKKRDLLKALSVPLSSELSLGTQIMCNRNLRFLASGLNFVPMRISAYNSLSVSNFNLVDMALMFCQLTRVKISVFSFLAIFSHFREKFHNFLAFSQ